MLKNILAAVGLFTLLHQGYEFYCHYGHLKREKEYWRRRCQEGE